MPRTRKTPGDDPPRIFRSEEELAQLPVSERVRYRLVDAGQRYHANDNLSLIHI